MRLSDIRPGRDDAPLPAVVETELEALDAALRGAEVPAGMEGIEALVDDLRAERPGSGTEFGDALDRWAAAGFPRGRRPGLSDKATASDPGGRARVLLASLTPRRLAPYAAAAATLVVIAVGVAQIGVDGGGDGGDQAVSDGGGDVATFQAEEPTTGEAEDSVSGEAGGAAVDANQPLTDADGRDTVEDYGFGSSAGPGALKRGAVQASGGDVDALSNQRSPGVAGGQQTRQVERDAQLTLAAPVDEVQDVTNEAIGVVQSYRGIVLSSQSSGTDDAARATLRLDIPTRNLDAALDDLSDLADVKSLSEGTLDITRPYVDTRDRLAGLRAERKSLYAQIRAADTQEELDELRLRLAALQREVARAEADFENIQRRARRSQVTLQVTSDGADEGDWSLEDALDDAGRVLTVGAGIALISAAVLLPLALIAAIAYSVLSAAKRRARERALDE